MDLGISPCRANGIVNPCLLLRRIDTFIQHRLQSKHRGRAQNGNDSFRKESLSQEFVSVFERVSSSTQQPTREEWVL
jgi:hypothetical protein